MNYEEMNCHDVNMAVTCIENNCQGWSVTASNTGFYHCGFDGGGFFEVDCVDYCNNPSYSWSIILDNNIEITPSFNGSWTASCIKTYTFEEEPIYDNMLSHSDESPLKAAMICFLKMHEAGVIK